jgi:sporulation protein YunB
VINFFVYFYKNNINNIITESIEIKCRALAVRAMNTAIGEVIMEKFVYEDLIDIVNNNNGEIALIRANAIEINNLSRDLSLLTEENINKLGNNGIKIPVGNFTGVPLLVGIGPNINLKIKPVGAVVCRFKSKFETAGINQTNHKIYLTISSNVSTVLPLVSSSIGAEQEVLISESIIIGKVPEVYLYSDQLDTLLNFVPY